LTGRFRGEARCVSLVTAAANGQERGGHGRERGRVMAPESAVVVVLSSYLDQRGREESDAAISSHAAIGRCGPINGPFFLGPPPTLLRGEGRTQRPRSAQRPTPQPPPPSNVTKGLRIERSRLAAGNAASQHSVAYACSTDRNLERPRPTRPNSGHANHASWFQEPTTDHDHRRARLYAALSMAKEVTAD
jgi:hypothetical protein